MNVPVTFYEGSEGRYTIAYEMICFAEHVNVMQWKLWVHMVHLHLKSKELGHGVYNKSSENNCMLYK